MQNAAEPRDIGVASAANTFFRQLGGTLGTAIFLSVLFSAAPTKIGTAFAKAKSDPAFQRAAANHPDQLASLQHASGSLNDTGFLQSIDSALRHPFLVGFSQAMDVVFIAGAISLIPALVLALIAREVPMRRVAGIAAVRAGEAADVAAARAGEAADVAAARAGEAADVAAARAGEAADVAVRAEASSGPADRS
jgi:hypothetical protein